MKYYHCQHCNPGDVSTNNATFTMEYFTISAMLDELSVCAVNQIAIGTLLADDIIHQHTKLSEYLRRFEEEKHQSTYIENFIQLSPVTDQQLQCNHQFQRPKLQQMKRKILYHKSTTPSIVLRHYSHL